jgi:hypothetical protein
MQQKGLFLNSAQQKYHAAAGGTIHKLCKIKYHAAEDYDAAEEVIHIICTPKRRSGCSRRCSFSLHNNKNQATETLQKKRTVCTRRGCSLTLHSKKIMMQQKGLFINSAQ